MHLQLSRSDKIFNWLNIVLVGVFTLIILYPLLFVVFASLSDPRQIFDNILLLWPRGFTLEGYKRVFENQDIWMGFKNAIIYTVLGTAVNVIMTTLAAYPLSRRDFRGRNVITMLFTFTMFFSGGLIPSYLVNQQLGIVNTMWVMILPGAVSVYNMIIMRTYFQQNIPQELEESAFIDGATDMQLLIKVVLPLSTPIIAVMMMFYGVGRWNGYFDAMIYLSERELFPLQLILREILVQNQMGDAANQAIMNSNQGEVNALKQSIKYAVVVVSSVPVLVFYPIVSKYFEKGIMVGAIKG
ncbi:carbohydrate ABC transporter permease [Paenibacillus macquariensis]|uniref:Carbohydrate ABC transporter membrane protein 2, CUT1 family n=1 Tax=Paenibacillus macquariensis TaxID=948756 RepID=A0ABY1JK42_9BACL|nr:carbohydrate ABC transporter permease [Paenibacillus macquariensis]MEC0089858.1 carbohydrate ABC transporter permease [Paenibacillus macquariensis]OAB30678.1 sugar ABC transporter permease [Paenibacillus macquariensis subsp. macquariensis]SIQ32781.1 carbohydrate ABC transporter membrane protein 2, CUT1 family [Paenibacillus macquariensis]